MPKYAYYNEIDPKAAAWLRELIKAGHITDGEVDERSIEDVLPSELAGYTQCHFFAGIGVWSHALRQAGWPDDRPVWTGSCPCQPFSAAGKRGGVADERHLWPAFHWLISQCRPDVVFGEQVASKDGLAWLDIVQSDMEAAGYAIGSVDLCAAGFGAPHIRQRLYFVAESLSGQEYATAARRFHAESGSGSAVGELADAASERRQPEPHEPGSSRARSEQTERGKLVSDHGDDVKLADATKQRYDGRRTSESERSRNAGILDDPVSHGRRARGNDDGSDDGVVSNATCELDFMDNSIIPRLEGHAGDGDGNDEPGWQRAYKTRSIAAPGATNGFWRDAEWLYCRDGKYRAVEPGTFPLAHGVAARVGRLRGYGNAIVAPVAEAFIRAYLGEDQ